MKKQYFLMAMAATMFAACSQTEVIDEVVDNSTPKAIGFTTYTEGQTRAENSGEDYSEDLYDHHVTFKVWAYKDVADDKVFDGDVVTYKDVDGSDPVTQDWQYDNTRYWDKAATTYQFYAAAPQRDDWHLNMNTEDQGDDYFTLASFELKGDNANKNGFSDRIESFKGKLENDIDLMIADEKEVSYSNFGKDVELNFIHILSRLNITVKKATQVDDVVNLVKLEVVNLKNFGNFDESKKNGTDLSNGTTDRWEKINNYNIITYNKSQEVSVYKQYAVQALVIPQNAEVEDVRLDGKGMAATPMPYIRIEYTITPTGSGAITETFVAYYNLATAFTVSSPSTIAFNEGWENNLHITITPSKIEFDANVAKWDEHPHPDLEIK